MEEGRPLRYEEGRQKKLCDKFSDLSIVLIGFVFFSSIFPRLSSFALTFTDSHPLTSSEALLIQPKAPFELIWLSASLYFIPHSPFRIPKSDTSANSPLASLYFMPAFSIPWPRPIWRESYFTPHQYGQFKRKSLKQIKSHSPRRRIYEPEDRAGRIPKSNHSIF